MASDPQANPAQGPRIELNGVRIWAIPFENGRALPPRKLPCGSIVREPTAEQQTEIPDHLPDRFELPHRPGLSVPFSGLFWLATGSLAAVYGAVPEILGGSG